jgi:glutamate-5-semialdehyde dehydrogenase
MGLLTQAAIAHYQAMLDTLLIAAKTAARSLLSADRNAMLTAIAAALKTQHALILQANHADVQAARASGMSEALLDRLALTPARLDSIIASISDVANLPDPLGHVLAHWQHPNGMQIRKRSVPFGVIGVIYESRPNVTVDAAVLCLKAGSAVVLRGSSNTLASNRALTEAMRAGLECVGADPNVITLVDSTERSEVTAMLNARGKIDLLIPRGGAALIQHVIEHARVPVIETGTGVCHLYVHASADLDQALAILLNGKVQRPGVCNSLETLLVDVAIAPQFLPPTFAALTQAGVEIRACGISQTYAPKAQLATDADYVSEFLDLVIAVKVVANIDSALAHIDQFSTLHSEVICAQDAAAIQQFCEQVDAACVYANASTRFSDGFEFGFGAEIGISTQKMHARGPMGLREIVTYKYVIDGSGQVR